MFSSGRARHRPSNSHSVVHKWLGELVLSLLIDRNKMILTKPWLSFFPLPRSLNFGPLWAWVSILPFHMGSSLERDWPWGKTFTYLPFCHHPFISCPHTWFLLPLFTFLRKRKKILFAQLLRYLQALWSQATVAPLPTGKFFQNCFSFDISFHCFLFHLTLSLNMTFLKLISHYFILDRYFLRISNLPSPFFTLPLLLFRPLLTSSSSITNWPLQPPILFTFSHCQ